MNRTAILSWMLFFLIILSCDKDNKELVTDYLKYKEVAWNSLSPETHEIVLHHWRDAEATITKNPDSSELVIVVIFHTPYDALTCAISVYVDILTEEVIYP